VVERLRKGLILVLGVFLSLFLFYTAGFGQFSPMIQRGIPMMTAVILVFLVFPAFGHYKKVAPWQWAANYILILMGSAVIFYVVYYQEEIALRLGRANTLDFIVSTIGILIVLEITRRSTAPALAYISMFFLGYALFGHYLPGMLGHRALDLPTTAVYLYLSQEGIFGSSIDVMVSFIFVFMLLGSFLEATGAGKHVINVAYGITGKMTGGPALTAVLASSMFGTVSGSPVANVSGTGTFTIPLMKRTGYHRDFAGAVEAVASTGGQIMPPVMGASAFLMSEILGIPYIEIAVRALVPAVLFYLCLFLTVYLRAKRMGLKGLPKEELPSVKKSLLDGGHMFFSLVLLVALLVLNYSPAKAAFWSILVLFLSSLTRSSSRLSVKGLFDTLAAAGKQSLGIFSALACVGIIIGVISLTGLGVKFSILVTSAAGSLLLLALVFVAIAALILGMGLPPVAAYLLLVVIAGPAIESLGALLFTAHMFVFYFAAMAPITPPVALAAYTAAGISGGNPMATGWNASRLGIVGFVVPFMFVYAPELLLFGNLGDILWALLTASIGVLLLAVAAEGYLFSDMPWYLRITTLCGGLLMVYPGLETDIPGMVLVALMLLQQFIIRKKHTKITPSGKIRQGC